MKDENKELTPEQIEVLEKKNKKQKRKVIIRNIVIIGLIVIIILLLLAKCSSGEITLPETSRKVFDITEDKDSGEKIEKDNEELIQSLNDKIVFNKININPSVSINKETSEGNLNIENKNEFAQVVELYIEDDTEDRLIYQSDLIMPEKAIENASLDVDLAEGEYSGYYIIYGVDIDTGYSIGQSSVKATVKIEN